jgi:hypothetical protein
MTLDLCFAKTGHLTRDLVFYRYLKLGADKGLQFEICVLLEANKMHIKLINVCTFHECMNNGELA